MVNSTDVKCTDDNFLLNLDEAFLCGRSLVPLWATAVGIVSLLFISATLTALIFRYNQEIKVYLFSRGICLQWISEGELDEDKSYDAFISFAYEDEEIATCLVDALENGPHPYKICIHYRDFVPGEYISTQIVKSVENSRRTIIILSNNFLQSIWGKFEFQTAHLQAMKEKRVRLIVILFGEVELESLDNDLKAYIKTNTYLRADDPWFWEKLKYALPHRQLNEK